MTRAIVGGTLLLAGACGRASAPPDFALDAPSTSAETAASANQAAAGASVYVGFASTPPPGEYRFVRLHEDGRAETREVFAVNGPGPWLTYEGLVSIRPEAARAIVESVDALRAAPSAAPPATGAPCVLAYASMNRLVWQGCADVATARRVLDEIPRLAPAEHAPPCARPVCQVRLVLATPPAQHARYGRIAQEILADANGAFSCATPSPDVRDEPNVLQVIRGRIRHSDAGPLFDWLTDGVRPRATGRPPDDGLAASGVVVRGSGGAWTRVTTPQATALSARWARVAARLPPACRQPSLQVLR